MAIAHVPETISPGVPDKEDIGAGTSYFEFLNPSPYYVMVRFDWAESMLDAQPDHVIAPYTNQRVQTLGGPKDRICWVASTLFPKSPNPTGAPERFGFIATETPIQASPASVLSVGVQDAPQIAASAATLANLENTDQPGGASVLRAKGEFDTTLRFVLTNIGDILTSVGTANPTKALGTPAHDTLEVFKTLLLPAVDSGGLRAAARRGYVLDAIADNIAALPFDSRTGGQDPTAYPARLSYMLTGDTPRGWPVGFAWLFTFRGGASDVATEQMLIGAGRVFTREWTAGAAWTAWEESATQAFVNSGLDNRMPRGPFHNTGPVLNMGAATTRTITHNMGQLPRIITALWKPNGNTAWDVLGGFVNNGSIPYLLSVGDNAYSIHNPRTTAIDYRVTMWI